MECKNVGTVDQTFRLVIAIILVVLGIFILKSYVAILSIIAAIIVLTALFQYCPVYKLLGISTCPSSQVSSVKEAKEKLIEGQTTKGKRVSSNYRKESTASKKTSKGKTKKRTKTRKKSRKSKKR